MGDFFLKIKGFFVKYEHKVVLIVGFCLISAISFEFGVLQGQKWQQKPLIIEKPAEMPEQGVTGKEEAPSTSGSVPTTALPSKAAISTPTQKNGCAYVGSRSSDKFYVPTCSYAKRVKPENLVCFKTAEEAIGQGRTESKCK